MACAAALIVATALVPALSPTAMRDGPKWGAESRPVVLANANVQKPGALNRASIGVQTDDGRDSLAAARRSARSFVRAFLRYQLGGVSARTRATLARTASDAVEHYLVIAPAREVSDGRHPELRSMRLYARSRTEAKASALLRYGRRRSLFEFLLERGQREWRVVELYP